MGAVLACGPWLLRLQPYHVHLQVVIGRSRDSRKVQQRHRHTPVGRNSYILYFPRSSSFRPSSHFRSSSLVTRSDMFAASFEVLRTVSSTKIGQSTRSARARASEGRESMLMTSPPRSSQMTA